MATVPESHLKEEKKLGFTVLRVTSMGTWSPFVWADILETAVWHRRK